MNAVKAFKTPPFSVDFSPGGGRVGGVGGEGGVLTYKV